MSPGAQKLPPVENHCSRIIVFYFLAATQKHIQVSVPKSCNTFLYGPELKTFLDLREERQGLRITQSISKYSFSTYDVQGCFPLPYNFRGKKDGGKKGRRKGKNGREGGRSE